MFLVTQLGMLCLNSPREVTFTKSEFVFWVFFQNTGIEYKPGDSIGVVCPNNCTEVDFIIQHLSIQDKVDIPMMLHLLEGTKKKRAQVRH